jgi:uncharacterized protein (UPF0332 family)
MTTYLDRALEAARSAREMRESADYNGACNRAYYSVFYAASGLLEGVGDERPGKTHASLLRRFSERFVLSGEAPSQLGRALGVAHDLRSKADYSLAGAFEGRRRRCHRGNGAGAGIRTSALGTWPKGR